MQIKRALIIMRSRALNKNLAAWPKVPLAARTDTSAKKEHKSRDMEWSSQSQALSYHGVVVLVPSIHHEQCKVLGQVFFICFSFLLVQYQTTSTTPLLSCLSLSLSLLSSPPTAEQAKLRKAATAGRYSDPPPPWGTPSSASREKKKATTSTGAETATPTTSRSPTVVAIHIHRPLLISRV
jgi:hypothetical protein